MLGLAFIAAGTFLGYAGIRAGSDLIGIATVIGALSGGLLAIVWGNAKEHQAANGSVKPQ